MKFDPEDAVRVLSRTPATLDALLRGLPTEWTHADEGPDTWSPYDIVGHLVHGEQDDWIPRARRILEHGVERAFEPFDRFAQFEKSKGKSMEDLLDEFAAERRRSVEELRALALTPDDLAKRGTHTDLGPVTMSELLAAWVAHDLGHLRQIARVMAKQYAEAVGPRREYMPVMEE